MPRSTEAGEIYGIQDIPLKVADSVIACQYARDDISAVDGLVKSIDDSAAEDGSFDHRPAELFGNDYVCVKIQACSLDDRSQIDQLFNNLISYTPKFRNPDGMPHIKLSCKLITRHDLLPKVELVKLSDNYFQIAVADNRIVFKPQIFGQNLSDIPAAAP